MNFSGPPRVFLASRSPRRASLLREWGVPFREIPPGPERAGGEEEGPFEAVLLRAREKCLGAELPAGTGRALVLGADTLVVDPRGRILGKPADRKEAREFLFSLSGESHLVLSGVWARTLPGENPGRGGVEATVVRFRTLSGEEIEAYLDGGEWKGKAGAYAVQGGAGRFVRSLEGERENVVGLPKALTLFLLESLGAPWNGG